jgi:hypothetical protein
MESTDLEIGPIQRTFEALFWRIGQYFDSAPVTPVGSIIETDLSIYPQDSLHNTLYALLKHYGFTELPHFIRIAPEKNSHISGLHRSDNITTYEIKTENGCVRTFNFYSTYGPENMKCSFYLLNNDKQGEEIQGILTMDDRWYLRITTTDKNIYYLRMEKQKPQW